MKKNCLLIFIFFLLLFISSCYTQRIVLQPDKNSGELIIDYTLTDDTFQLLSFAFYEISTANTKNNFPVEALIDANLFKQKFAEKASKNVRLKSILIDTKSGYKGHIVIEFKNLNELIKELPTELVNFTLTTKDSFLELNQEINFKKIDKEGKLRQFILEQKTDDINFYNYLVKEAKFQFILDTATNILQAKGVKLSNANKRAEYTFFLGDYIKNENLILNFFIRL